MWNSLRVGRCCVCQGCYKQPPFGLIVLDEACPIIPNGTSGSDTICNTPAPRTTNIVRFAHEELTDLFLVAQNALVIEEAGHYL